MFVFNIIIIFIANVKAFHTKKCMNKPQTEGRVITSVQKNTGEVQHSSAIKHNVSLSKVMFE